MAGRRRRFFKFQVFRPIPLGHPERLVLRRVVGQGPALVRLSIPGGCRQGEVGVGQMRPGERYQIRSGDRLRLGTLELQIVDPAKVGAKVAAAPR